MQTRTVVAGLVAGIVLNVSGMISALVMDLPASFARFAVQPSLATALLHSGLRLAVGVATAVIATWAGRRGGSALRAAGTAGLLVWVIGYVPPMFVLSELGVLSSGQLQAGLLWGLAEACLAAYVSVRLTGSAGAAP